MHELSDQCQWFGMQVSLVVFSARAAPTCPADSCCAAELTNVRVAGEPPSSGVLYGCVDGGLQV